MKTIAIGGTKADIEKLDSEMAVAFRGLPERIATILSTVEHGGFGTAQMSDGEARFFAGVDACAKRLASVFYPLLALPYPSPLELHFAHTLTGVLAQGVHTEICKAFGHRSGQWPISSMDMCIYFDDFLKQALQEIADANLAKRGPASLNNMIKESTEQFELALKDLPKATSPRK